MEQINKNYKDKMKELMFAQENYKRANQHQFRDRLLRTVNYISRNTPEYDAKASKSIHILKTRYKFDFESWYNDQIESK